MNDALGRVILLDIEGTVSEIAFVHDVLFPYARRHVRDVLLQRMHQPEVGEALQAMARDAEAESVSDWCPYLVASPEGIDWVVERIHAWMDHDAKLTGLKAMQGLIWEAGYQDGSLKSHIFPDVPKCLRRWVEAGRTIAIYSSGSRAAQRLLFAHTTEGDLTPWITAYFDTTSGGKRVASSYQTIACQLGVESSGVLFLSDVPEELTSAASVGMQTGLVVRPGNRPTADVKHRRVTSLEEILI